jgi:hypothetical protein
MGRIRRVATIKPHPIPPTLLGMPPVRTLDLHGLTAASAERKVLDFVATSARSASGQIVRIVTGKGKRSDGGPVLQPLVHKLLETRLARYIETFVPDGGGFLLRIK